MKKNDIRAIKRAERERCIRLVEAVLSRYDGMGFRHNADRAQGARECLEALRPTESAADYTVSHVSGLNAVPEPW